MKILMITSYLPYPPFGGGEVRTYNLLKRLGKRHKITLIAYTRPTNTVGDIREVQKLCQKVITLPKIKTWTIKNILRTGFSTMPLLLTVYHSKKDTQEIGNTIRQNSFDLIHVEPFYIMHNIPITNHPLLLVEHNIEYLAYQRYVNHYPLIPLRPLLYIDVMKMKEWEEVMWKRANMVMAVSDSDKRVIEGTGVKDVQVVPNGVDLDYLKFHKIRFNKCPVILYVGDMRWFENRDAVSFILKLWPEIQRQIPTAHLLIVGRETGKYFKPQTSNSIEVVSNIPDIRLAYTKANCLLAPIRKGSGTKYKILEAMAAGTPVITTDIGKEGLAIENNKHVKIANTDRELIQATIEVLTNRDMVEEMARNARRLIEQNYSWDMIAQKLDSVYKEVADAKK